MKIGVFLHLYYLDLWPELLTYLKNIPGDVELLVNFTEDISLSEINSLEKSIKDNFQKYDITISENRGMDIGGFINIINHAIDEKKDYDLVIFLHTKKHARTDPELGKKWRKDLIQAVLGSKYKVNSILDIFEKNDIVGMIGSSNYVIYLEEDPYNKDWIDYYAKKLGIEDLIIKFVGGSIFWSRWQPLCNVFSKNRIEVSEFEESEVYANDGMKAHAIERLLGSIIMDQGLEVMGVEPEIEGLDPDKTTWYQQQNKCLEKYVELKTDLSVLGNIYPAVFISDQIGQDVFNLFKIILQRQFGVNSKRITRLNDLCLIKTVATIKFISDFHKNEFENHHLYQEYTRYSEEFKSGDYVKPTYLVHPSVLEKEADMLLPRNLYQLDGMRRIMSAVYGDIGSIDTYVLIRRDCLKEFIDKRSLREIKEVRSKCNWQHDYQEISEIDLNGYRTRSPRYPQIYDFSMMKNQTVVDFGGNIGQATLEAFFNGAKYIYNLDSSSSAIDAAKLISQLIGSSVINEVIDFNDKEFPRKIFRIVDEWDWAIFQDMYGNPSIDDPNYLLKFIINNSRKGIVFEGIPGIEDSYYREIFNKYNIDEIEFRGETQGRLAYILKKDVDDRLY